MAQTLLLSVLTLHLISSFFSPQEMVAEFLSSAGAMPREKQAAL